MKKVCAWCQRPLNDEPASGDPVSHGICRRCLEYALSSRIALKDFLDSIDAPVLAVDEEVRAIGANDQALRIVGKDLEQVEDRLGGEVIQCEHAALPGGCGRTVHCTGCQIRGSVIHTRATGEPLLQVPAYQHVMTPAGVKTYEYRISTEEMADGVVLLRIDEAREIPDP